MSWGRSRGAAAGAQHGGGSLAAAGLVVGGAGLLLRLEWWRPALVGSAEFSAVVITVFWAGTRRRARDQGQIGLLIDLVLVVAVLVLGWHPA